MKTDLNSLKNQVKEELKKEGGSLGVYRKYLGPKGEITQILRSLKDLPEKERKEKGKLANEIKNEIEKAVESGKYKTRDAKYKTQDAHFDITVPGKKPSLGHLHPLTLARREVEEIFESMGFSVIGGPEMEKEWYNFDALNIPKDHPARDQWDTFYLKNGLLLRTHTSPVQVRYMEKNNPPLRIIVPGPVFRHEATDISHEFELMQVEGLMVDKTVSVANFKAVIDEFFRRFFKKDVKTRLRQDFFPFTEPSFDVSISCVVCGGKGCPTCKKSGWVELAGAGMVHPNVFKNSGLIPKDWQGWAFGFGLERLVMMKYKINDVRLFRSGDLRFLNQF
ncbi:MAG: phenylalanine--tRNA ligase subunit alpha [Candidatus Nealsonbacteria bacterium RBG_13_42_11]|uniref:Phenylalanine--tRNA ligase alpha subunit n=1 Tax=Candidatus Nealsonbacteria bacterium RBG_13_42_11 TaxID=1801663 RepID=A0A1G2DYY2_9BACT|nr:MAG: phenylalanine--tRNA ligase subunit alpha [Candidatus Nealsonbacteria bacterium RBG_13_42_11]